MPTYEDCANCGELLSEPYGAGTDNKCVDCNSAEGRAKAGTPAAVAPSQQQEDTITHAGLPKAEQRQQVRVMTLITGRIEDRESPYEFNILDISKSGAKLRTAHALPNGTLTLAFAGAGTLHARSAWRDGFVGGVTFIESHKEVVAIIGKVMPPLESMLRAA